jgi:predicted ABC-type ATPase
MVGLPATGKSTRVDALATMNPDVFVYSTDSLLEEWAAEEGKTYDEVFSELISDATGAMNSALDVAVRERLDIIWDQTNLGAKKRAKIINRMRQAGYTVECECVLFPQGDSQQEDWHYRLASRTGKTIPANIVESMMDSFVMPTVEEGFDSVHYFDMYGNLID